MVQERQGPPVGPRRLAVRDPALVALVLPICHTVGWRLMRAVACPAFILCLIEFLIDHFEFPRSVIPRTLLALRLARGLPRDPRVSFDKANISRSLLIDYGRSELMLYVDVHDAVQGHIRYKVVLGEILMSVRGLTP